MIQYNTCPGDTIYKITIQYNTSYKSLTRLNKLNQLKWLNGQRLLIPTTENTSIKLIEHQIDTDETLLDIMNQYRITEDELTYFNNLTHLILENNQNISIENDDLKKDHFELK